MIIKNPETGHLFYSPYGEKGCCLRDYKNSIRHVYKLKNNIFYYDGLMSYKAFDSSEDSNDYYNSNVPLSAVEINEDMSLKTYKTGEKDLPFEFNILKVEFNKENIKYEEKKSNNHTVNGLNVYFTTSSNITKDNNAEFIKNLIKNLSDEYSQFHINEMCYTYYFYNKDSYKKEYVFDSFMIFNHVVAYNLNKEYREMVDNGFTVFIHSYSGLNKQGVFKPILREFYKFLKGRNFSEMPQEYVDIINKEFFSKEGLVELFYKYNFDTKSIAIFKRIFKNITYHAIDVFEKLRCMIVYGKNKENTLTPIKVLNKLDIFVSYRLNGKKKRVTGNQIYSLFKKIEDVAGPKELSNAAESSMDFKEWENYYNRLKEKENNKKYNILDKELSKDNYRSDCDIDKIMYIYNFNYRVRKIESLLGLSDELCDLIIETFFKNFTENDILLDVSLVGTNNSILKKIGIIKLNLKSGKAEYLDTTINDSGINTASAFSRDSISNIFHNIKDAVFKENHRLFLSREILKN